MTTEMILKRAERMITRLEGREMVLTCKPKKRSTLDDLIQIVSEETGLTWSEIKSQGFRLRTSHSHVTARHLIFFFACRELNLKVTFLAQLVGQDHTTVIHGRDTISKFLSIGDTYVTELHDRVAYRLQLQSKPRKLAFA